MTNNTVAVEICKQYDIELISRALEKCFNNLGGLSSYIKPNQTVLIKPDLYCATHPNMALTTHPSIVSALADLIYKIGAKCIIADSPKGVFSQRNIDKTHSTTQMLQASNNGHATLSNNDNITVINNPKGVHCREIYVLDAINDADIIINVGKLRCDKYLGLIGCSQNLFGLIPGKFKQVVRARCHTLKSYYNYNIDLNEALDNKVVLNVLDGIVGSEANNCPRILNTLIVGTNCYSVDSVALQLINQSPQEHLLLQLANERNKYSFEFNVLGDKIEPYICTDFEYSTSLENIKPGSSKSFTRTYNRTQKRPIINIKSCKGCKSCISACPMSAISMKSSQAGEYACIDYSKCISCFKCLHNCPYKIIETKTPLKYKKIESKIKKSLGDL